MPKKSEESIIRYMCQATTYNTEAARQLEMASKLPGMRLSVAQPDLHPGA